jgi:predicted TIM-barrel fold metal-dependent hydrolase
VFIDIHTHSPSIAWLEREMQISPRPGASSQLHFTWHDYERAMAVVDRAVVFGLAVADHTCNDEVAAFVRTRPEKYIGFMSVNPLLPDAPQEVERCVGLGLRGIKLGPIYQGYHPHDGRAYRIYHMADRYGLPILIHQGTTFPRHAPLKVADPLFLEDICWAHPDVPIIIAHMGHPWYDHTCVLMRKHPRLYADISALVYRPWQFYNALITAVEYGVADRLLFGSDFPFATPAETRAGLECINDLVAGTNLPHVPQEVIDLILTRDSFELLGIREP